MKMFDVQGIEIMASPDRVFAFLREPGNLPRWAHAFVSAGDGRARLETPAGEVDISLDVLAEASAGTVDWRLTFPDGGVGAGAVTCDRNHARHLHLQLRIACASRRTRTGRGCSRGADGNIEVRARNAQIVNGRPMTIEDLARKAVDGDRDAVEQLVRDLQGDVYGLALRMLWNREDAEDATQEILVRAITRLAQFDFRSKLKTWVYRIAVNYILDVKKSPVEACTSPLSASLPIWPKALERRPVRRRAIAVDRGSEGWLHAWHAPMPGPATSARIRCGRDTRPVRPRGRRCLGGHSGRCSASVSSTRALPSWRSRARIVVSPRTPRHVPATAACRRLCVSDVFAKTRWILRITQPRIERRAPSCVGHGVRRPGSRRVRSPRRSRPARSVRELRCEFVSHLEHIGHRSEIRHAEDRRPRHPC